ncbi:MAG: CCA tRNA nucleotidyltransferase [Acidisphaera sp.]|nr:CCA tRNA nucleotidyltransferase [Acidisphaera sp.]
MLAEPGLRAVLDALPEARLVGGSVRDSLAGLPVADIDLATPRRPDAVIEALRAAGLRALPTGLAHGTVTALAAAPDGRASFEITTLRRDIETDGRHAVVDYTEDWREDAARRDFTINALSMTRDGDIYDYFGGIADLAAGRVRFVGDPATRLTEDTLRVLRFFRFHARYGKGEPDPAALAAIRGAVPRLSRLSAERVWSELKRILSAPDPCPSIDLMARLGVLDAVLPEGADPARLARLVARGAPADPLLRLAALLTGDVETLAGRLRLSGEEQRRLHGLRVPAVPTPPTDDASLRRALADTPADMLSDRLWLAGDGPEWDELRSRIAAMPRPVFPLEGRDALALGMAPGPAVGEALRAVRAWWLDNGCIADADACRVELAKKVRPGLCPHSSSVGPAGGSGPQTP